MNVKYFLCVTLTLSFTTDIWGNKNASQTILNILGTAKKSIYESKDIKINTTQFHEDIKIFFNETNLKCCSELGIVHSDLKIEFWDKGSVCEKIIKNLKHKAKNLGGNTLLVVLISPSACKIGDTIGRVYTCPKYEECK